MFEGDNAIRIKQPKQRRSLKSRTCEVCGKEIPKGDLYYQYKPFPDNKFWYGWRDRCLDHPPRYYDEFHYYPSDYCTTIPIKRRLDYVK